jgi:fructose-1,6-bisphosphatase/inositol monophosphatase family enzyme
VTADSTLFLSRARGLIREVLPRVREGCGDPHGSVQTKRDGSLVTPSDTYVERTLKQGLSEIFVGVPILAEESAIDLTGEEQVSADTVYSQFFGARSQITIDPIDGTRNFVDGRREYCIAASLSVPRGGGIWPIAGVVAVPYYGLMYWCDETNVWVEDTNSGEISPLTRAASAQSALSVSSRDRAWLESRKIRLQLPWESSGSSVFDLVGTLTGRLSASIVGAQRLWDVMAPIAMAHRVGLVLRDLETGGPITSISMSDLSTDIASRPWGLERRMVLAPPGLSLAALIDPAP